MDKQRELSFMKNRSNNAVMSYLNERPPVKYMVLAGAVAAAAECFIGGNIITHVGTLVGVLAGSYAVTELYNHRMEPKKSAAILAGGVLGLIAAGFVPFVGPLVHFAAVTATVAGVSGLVSPYLSKLFRR